MKQIERRIRRLEERGPAKKWKYAVISDRPHEDLSEIDLASYPFTWVNGNRVVYVVDGGPPMSTDEWVEKYCTPD
jgi:hypothetical protein